MSNFNKRIFVGFGNSGQSEIFSYVSYLKKKGIKIDFWTVRKTVWKFPYDKRIFFSKNYIIQAFQRFSFLCRMIKKYDIFHYNNMGGFLNIFIDILILKFFKKKLVYTFKGEDSFEYTRASGFYLGEIKTSKYYMFKKRIRKHLIQIFFDKVILVGPWLSKFVRRYDDIIIYSIDVSEFRKILKQNKKSKCQKIRILHAYTDSKIKGSDFIIAEMKKLQKKFPNIVLSVYKNTPYKKLLKAYACADIIIDEIGPGWYGTMAAEALALKKPVLCRLDKKSLKMFEYKHELPIININKKNIGKKLEKLVQNKSLRETIGKKGFNFAKRRHCNKVIGEKYLEIYKSLYR